MINLRSLTLELENNGSFGNEYVLFILLICFFLLIFVLGQYIMVILKGSLDITLAGSKEPAAYGELVSIGGINSQVKKALIDAIARTLQANLSVPRTRFFLKVYDTTAGRRDSKL